MFLIFVTSAIGRCEAESFTAFAASKSALAGGSRLSSGASRVFGVFTTLSLLDRIVTLTTSNGLLGLDDLKRLPG